MMGYIIKKHNEDFILFNHIMLILSNGALVSSTKGHPLFQLLRLGGLRMKQRVLHVSTIKTIQSFLKHNWSDLSSTPQVGV